MRTVTGLRASTPWIVCLAAHLALGCGAPEAPPPARELPPAAPTDPFAALLDERARALIETLKPELAALGAKPRRMAVILRVVWTTIGFEPVSKIQAMAFLLPDGRLRWGVHGDARDPNLLELTTDLAYPSGDLADGVRRPLAAADHDCQLPLLPLADLATLPEVARQDTFEHGYHLADTCQVAAAARGAAWMVSFDWFGAILAGGDRTVLVTVVPKVAGGTFTFDDPKVIPTAPGDHYRLVDRAGAPVCDTGPACLELGAHAALTEEHALSRKAYARACDLGDAAGCAAASGRR